MTGFVEAPAFLWLLLLIAVPWWLFARPRRWDRSRSGHRRAWLRGTLLGLIVAACAIAAAGPRRAIPGGDAPDAGTNVVIVLDVSMSMLAQDVRPSRLAEARRQLLDRFDGRVNRDGAPRRIGLVVFGRDARMACPLTADRAAVRQALEAVSEDGAAPGGSDISAGLTRALAMLPTGPDSSAIVLVTDGERGPGAEADPADAARQLAARGINTVVVGVGSAEGAAIPVRGAEGDSVVANADGRPRLSRLDEGRLQSIAAAGGGRYETLEAGRPLALVFSAAAPRGSADSGPFGPVRWHGVPLAVALTALTFDTVLWWFARRREIES
jgi:Ca-activated chloride channel family protein